MLLPKQGAGESHPWPMLSEPQGSWNIAGHQTRVTVVCMEKYKLVNNNMRISCVSHTHNCQSTLARSMNCAIVAQVTRQLLKSKVFPLIKNVTVMLMRLILKQPEKTCAH